MPEGLAELLRRCFIVEPEQRPQDMREVAALLGAIYPQVTG